jgi:hypothetical protein
MEFQNSFLIPGIPIEFYANFQRVPKSILPLAPAET